jgi:hypothetical protein
MHSRICVTLRSDFVCGGVQTRTSHLNQMLAFSGYLNEVINCWIPVHMIDASLDLKDRESGPFFMSFQGSRTG